MNRADGTGLFDPFLAPVPLSFGVKASETADFDADGVIDVAITSRDGPCVSCTGT